MPYLVDEELEFNNPFVVASMVEGDRLFRIYGINMTMEFYCMGWDLG